MASVDIPMDIHQPDEADHDYEDNGDDKRKPLIKYYQPTELIPSQKGPLHDLLLKQPAVLGSLQMVSGLLSIGLGFLFAATQEPNKSLLILLRVAPVTGILFFIAGLLSNLLFKYPGLLPLWDTWPIVGELDNRKWEMAFKKYLACLLVNIGSMGAALIGGVLIVVDLVFRDPTAEHHFKLEILMLCMLLGEVATSAILSLWIHKKKPIHEL